MVSFLLVNLLYHFFSSREKESSKITFFYLIEKEKDTLEKDDIIQTFRGEWTTDTSKYENIDSYIKNHDFNKIKKEIEERYNENKEFIDKINERLKEK